MQRFLPVTCCGVAKAGPGRVRAKAGDHVRPAYVTRSCAKHAQARG